MKRRKFLISSGSAVLGSTGILYGLRQPAIGLEFELATIPNEKPQNIDSVTIDFEKFRLNPRYLNVSEDIQIQFSVTLDEIQSRTVKQNVSADSPVSKDDISTHLPLVLDGIDTSQTAINGELEIEVSHTDIGNEMYRQSFRIEDNPLLNGLIAYYPLEKGRSEVAPDGAGGHLGQIHGASWSSDAPVGNNSINLGDGDYISSSDQFGIGEDSTISMWVYLESNSEYPLLSDKSITRGSGESWLFGVHPSNSGFHDGSNNLQFGIYGGSWDTISAGEPVPTGTWTHCAVTRKNGTWKIFMNGNKKNTISSTNTETETTIRNIGVNHSGSGSVADTTIGKIDEVRFYNRGLSESEIQDLYELNNTSGNLITESILPSQNDGGILRYKFNESVKDSWNGYNGTDNTSSGYTEGIYDKAKVFGGSGDINIPTIPNLDSFSVSVWFNAEDDTYIRLFQLFENNGIILEIDGNKDAQFRIDDSSGNKVLTAAQTPGDWYHFVATWDGTKMKHYLNGSLTGETNQDQNVSQSGADVIGSTGSGTRLFKGQLDDLRLYDRDLTESEVEKLFNKGAYRVIQ